VSGGYFYAEEAPRLLPVPHLHTDLSDCDHVVDLILDQTGGRPSQGHPGSDITPHTLNAARQFAKVTTASLVHQGKLFKLIFLMTSASKFPLYEGYTKCYI
jgi:hypothetical protein